ncbi:hypothetical protein TrRE_jg13341 [Triparma retinervis]|uniref:Uncharacterized protein n=1 Tax=Triparma retinervis TaxID=2557542 RepID=A0A9W6Z3L5_9STRA|nr:hypothetical protein TrRE_jg13341 [Triparma retinervis]
MTPSISILHNLLLLLLLLPSPLFSLSLPTLSPTFDVPSPNVFTFPKSPPLQSSPFSSHLCLPTSFGPPGSGILIDQCEVSMLPSLPPSTKIKAIVLTSKAGLLSPKLDPSHTPQEMLASTNPSNQPLLHLSNSLSSPLIIIHRHDVPPWLRMVPGLNLHVLDGYGPWSLSLSPSGSAVCSPSSPSYGCGFVFLHHCPGFTLGSVVVSVPGDGLAFTGNAVPVTERLDGGGVISEMKSVGRAMESLGGIRGWKGVGRIVTSREGAREVGGWEEFVDGKVGVLERFSE